MKDADGRTGNGEKSEWRMKKIEKLSDDWQFDRQSRERNATVTWTTNNNSTTNNEYGCTCCLTNIERNVQILLLLLHEHVKIVVKLAFHIEEKTLNLRSKYEA